MVWSMGLRFCVLASGSTGNASIIANDEVSLLMDVGLSTKKLEQMMETREWHPKKLEAILVTHEHSDHIKGLSVMARKYKLPVYANENTWKAIDHHMDGIDAEQRCIMETGSVVEFGSLRVESFAISHDAAEPVGYCFSDGSLKVSFATDLGYMSERVRDKVIDSDVLILESNHDVDMLRVGRYPWNIKRRILSDMGHLSNEAAGEALSDMIEVGKLRRVYLAHLSREHNVMDLAKLTVHNVIEERGFSLQERKLKLMETYYDRPTMWDAVGMD
jgi:phosphoribosyl 1,2-cyclic phosphodiesterase